MVRLSASALFGILLLAAVSLRAQCPETTGGLDGFSKPAAPGELLLPEDANLSDTTYTSRYFGFALDLPLTAQGHQIMLPLMPEGQHALLAIGYQDGGRSGSMTVNAIEPSDNVDGAAAEAEQQRYEATMPVTAQQATVQPGLEPGTLRPAIVPAGTDPVAEDRSQPKLGRS